MKVRIIATTDLHGSVFPTNYTSLSQENPYSLAHIASAIKAFRQDETVILVDNGDAFQGTPFLTYAHQHADSVENPIATVFNTLNYDFINCGNHDFNYGEAIFTKFIEEVKAPLLTQNVLRNNQPLGKTQIVEIDGKKIAFIGVVTHYIPHWERPEHIKNFVFLDAFKTMRDAVSAIRPHVDYVVGMYHGGLERDPETGVPTERLTGENQGYQMLHEIAGLDILITGHQHRSFAQHINGVALTQTTLKGEEFASIELDLQTGVTTPHLHKTQDFPLDPTVLKPLESLQAQTQTWLDTPLGTIDDASPSLLVEDPMDARLHKHPLVSFINQVQLDRSHADIASFALFNDAVGFKKSITMRDLVCTYIYPNTLVVKDMSGAALKAMIEFSAHYFTLDEFGAIRVSPEFESPKPQHYNYDMFDGIDYTLNIAKPRGSRLESISYQGAPVGDDDHFKVVMNNYRSAGGGNYEMVLNAPIVEEIQEEMVDTLMNYIQNHQPVSIVHKDNIKIVSK